MGPQLAQVIALWQAFAVRVSELQVHVVTVDPRIEAVHGESREDRETSDPSPCAGVVEPSRLNDGCVCPDPHAKQRVTIGPYVDHPCKSQGAFFQSHDEGHHSGPSPSATCKELRTLPQSPRFGDCLPEMAGERNADVGDLSQHTACWVENRRSETNGVRAHAARLKIELEQAQCRSASPVDVQFSSGVVECDVKAGVPSIPQCQMKECANSSFWVWVPGLPSFGFQAPREAQPSELSGYATRAARRYVDADVLVPVHPPFESTGLLHCVDTARCPSAHVCVIVAFDDNRQPVPVCVPVNATSFDVCKAAVCNGRLFYLDVPWDCGYLALAHGMTLVCRRTAVSHGKPCCQHLALIPYVRDTWESQQIEPCALLRHQICRMTSAVWSLSCDFSRLSLPSAVVAGLHSTARADVFPHALVRDISVYVDGSAMAGDVCPSAGASFNVWKHAIDGSTQFVGYHSSRVRVEEGELDAACVAECQALAHAIMWVMACPLKVKFRVHYDSMRAGKSASGEWQPSSGSRAASEWCMRVRHLVLLAERIRLIEFCHTKAHMGCCGNELADVCAKAAAIGSCHTPTPDECLDCLCGENLPWAWALAPRSEEGLPPAEMMISRIVSKPKQTAEADLRLGVTEVGLDTQRNGVLQHEGVLTLASYNVQTALDADCFDPDERLYGGAKINLMQEVFAAQGWTIVGLQETRLGGAGIRTNQRYMSIQSGSVQGNLGVALWISRQWPDPFPREPFQARHLAVLHADPRRLFVRCISDCIKLDVCVCHAPHRGRGTRECEEWWDATDHLLAKFASPSIPMIFLSDANARGGAPGCDQVGGVGAEECDVNGVALQDLMCKHSMWIPSTFEQCHVGGTHTFIAVRDQSHHRNDYIAIPDCWGFGCVVQSRVEYSVDIGQKSPDHFPVVLECRVPFGRAGRRKSATRQRQWDVANVQVFDCIMDACPQPQWECSVDLHADILTRHLQHVQQKVFARRRQRPIKPYISPQTWALIKARGSLKAQLVQHDQRHARVMMSRAFKAWHGSLNEAQRLTGLLETSRRQHAVRVRVYSQSCYDVRAAVKLDKANYLQEVAAKCHMAMTQHQSRQVYQALKFFRPPSKNVRRKGGPLPQVALEDGSLAVTPQQISDRWLEHFAQVEAAEVVPRELLPMVAHDGHERSAVECICSVGGCVPTLVQWEQALRKTKLRKHPGPDGIKSELLRVKVPTVARATYSLILKTSMCCAEPLRYKGGLLAALYKGRGAHADCSNSRSILLANTIGKQWHSCLRSELVPVVKESMLPSQAGAVPGRGLDTAALSVRAFAWWSQEQGLSAAALFVDIRSAFYSVFRPLLLGHSFDDDKLAYAMRHLKIPEIYAEWLRDIVSEGDVATRVGVPSFLRMQLLDTLTHSWFVTQNSQEMGYSWAGTRPGDPLRDVLYVMLCAHVLEEVRQHAHEQGLWTKIGDDVFDSCPTWVDDSTFLIADSNAELMLQKTKKLCGLVHTCFGKHGLVLNTSRGKTEVLPIFRGERAQAVQMRIEDEWDTGLGYCALDGTHSVHFTNCYKHLGSLFDRSLSVLPEIRARLASARAEAVALRKPVLSAQQVPLYARVELFHGLVGNKLTFQIGIWKELRIRESKAWRHGTAALYRMLLPDGHRHAASSWSLHALCGYLGVPHPDSLISVARCQVLDHVALSEDGGLHLLLGQLHHELSWIEAVRRDLSWAAQLGCLDLGLARGSLVDWIHASKTGISFALQIRKALHKHVHLMGQRSQVALGSPSVDTVDVGVDVAACVDRLRCPVCDKPFESKRQLATHANRVHAVTSRSRFFAGPSNNCCACSLQFATRRKLLAHLGVWSRSCLTFLQAHFHPLSIEDVRELDARDGQLIKEQRRRGRPTDAERRLCRYACVPADLCPVGDEPPRPIPVLCSEDLPGEKQHHGNNRKAFEPRPSIPTW